MAGVLARCARPPALPACGNRFRNQAALRWRKGDLVPTRPLAGCRPPNPRDGSISDGRTAPPEALGVPAASQPACMQKSSTGDSFRVIYRFPGIRACRALSRVKLLQTAVTVLALPPVWVFHHQELLTLNFSLYATGLTCFALTMLYAMSFYLRRIVGLMYLSEDGALLKVSHLTFWGRRHDLYCPVEAVMPLAEAGEHRNKVLLRFKRYDTGEFLYFSLLFGQVTDRQGFAQVFGEL